MKTGYSGRSIRKYDVGRGERELQQKALTTIAIASFVCWSMTEVRRWTAD